MKRIICILFLISVGSLAQGSSGCYGPNCLPAKTIEGRFSAYGNNYVLSIPWQFLRFNMNYMGEIEWSQIKIQPRNYDFKHVFLNYRWDNLEPWDGANEVLRQMEVHLATKTVLMRVANLNSLKLPSSTIEEKINSMNRVKKFQHNILSNNIYRLTHSIDWSNDDNQKMVNKLKSIGLHKTSSTNEWSDNSKNILSSDQLKIISDYQKDKDLYYFSYAYISNSGKKERTRKIDYYWYINDELNIIIDWIICTFDNKESFPPVCELRTSVPEKQLSLEISFSGWHLKQWKQIKANSIQLLESFITQVED